MVIDDFEAARKAVSHLLQQGCRKIAYIGGSPTLLINQRRLEGYRDALDAFGIQPDQRLIKHVEYGTVEDGMKAADELLQEEVTLDGLFTTADMPAIGAIKYFRQKGLRVPGDVAVVGFSNWQIAEVFEPPLTTIRQPGREMGSSAMNLLLNRMNGMNGGPQTQVLDTELLIRASSMKK